MDFDGKGFDGFRFRSRKHEISCIFTKSFWNNMHIRLFSGILLAVDAGERSLARAPGAQVLDGTAASALAYLRSRNEIQKDQDNHRCRAAALTLRGCAR